MAVNMKDNNTAWGKIYGAQAGKKLKRAAACFLALTSLSICMGNMLSGQENSTPTPRDVWMRFKKNCGPLQYTINSDKIIRSETDPEKKLRLVEFSFSSQTVPYKREAGGVVQWEIKELRHEGAVYIPVDPDYSNRPERKGKVAVVGSISGPYRQSFLINYGDSIAASTGYPVMILPNPGEMKDIPGREYSQGMLIEYRRSHADLVHHSHFRWAVAFLDGMDILAEILDISKADIRAVIGGHSKRATSAYIAAAIDPDRVAGVVFMGNESLHPEGPESPWWAVSPYYAQRFVRCPVLYLGATNESGYPMFNINRIQEHMDTPWTLEMIPNYWHAAESEIQFLNWRMWVAHVFNGRPLTRISDLHQEKTGDGIMFQAKIESPNRIIMAQVWYTRGNLADRRNLIWYPVLLANKEENLYECTLRGDPPTAWLMEVQDTAQGFRSYVSSLPQNYH